MASSRSLKKCLLTISELRKCNGQFIGGKHLRKKEKGEKRNKKGKEEREKNDNSLEKRSVP